MSRTKLKAARIIATAMTDEALAAFRMAEKCRPDVSAKSVQAEVPSWHGFTSVTTPCHVELFAELDQ